jgi:hypothetical protein
MEFLSSKHCLTILGGITRLIVKTHTSSTCCLGIGSTIQKFGMKIGLVVGSIWVSTSMVPMIIGLIL